MAGVSFPLMPTGFSLRPPYCKQPARLISPVSTVGCFYYNPVTQPRKRLDLISNQPIFSKLSATPCSPGNGDCVNKGGSITDGPQLPVPMSNTALDMGCTAMVMVGAYVLVSAFDVLTKRNILDQNRN
eukprot:Gb_35728 [translate_table: standard]